jgi:hypothetical protein
MNMLGILCFTSGKAIQNSCQKLTPYW